PSLERLSSVTRARHAVERRGTDQVRNALKVAAIVGARPNFVKIASIIREMDTRPVMSTTLIHTGQRYDGPMWDSLFANLELPNPDVNLHVQAPSATAQIAEIMLRLEPVLASARPHLVLVVGGVNCTL